MPNQNLKHYTDLLWIALLLGLLGLTYVDESNRPTSLQVFQTALTLYLKGGGKK